MDENKEAPLGELEKLAFLADAIQHIFPKGGSMVVFELEKEDYDKMMSNFRQMDHHHKQFTIEISGVDFHFMLNEGKS
jgi:hypothetical protein